MLTMESMLAIDTVLHGDAVRHNDRINRTGWWQAEPGKRAPLRAKLAASLAAVANRLSPSGSSTSTTTPCAQA